ncbi:MAG: carboxymuconolactone decarboxylase family protein [Hamadaea sp.]|nr:carboxymuconolactone decarboxylase family protein [Hamadaea sp.]
MPHIPVPDDPPGIRGLLAFKPAIGVKVSELIHELLRGPSPLTPAEREHIAAHVSRLNDCEFCARSHAAAERHLLVGVQPVRVADVPAQRESQEPSLMGALLAVAEAVVRGGRHVSEPLLERVRAAGGGDEHIHDTVLIASAFCMLNRYVDGLAAVTPGEDAAYEAMGAVMAARGYARPAPVID